MEKEDTAIEALKWSYEMVTSESLIPSDELSYEDLKNRIAFYLDELLAKDFNRLISILYRIDISQEKAMAALAENFQKETAGETLAGLIIERQLQKIETRRKYRK